LLKTASGALPQMVPDVLSTYNSNLAARRTGGDVSFDTTTRCASPGMPRILTIGRPFEIIQRSDQTIFLFSWNRLYRQIEMTSKLPTILYPTPMGRSIGHWEGQVMVVTTTGIGDNTLLDDAIPTSETLEIVERLSIKDHRLQDSMTFTDPASFRAPWSTVLTFRRVPPPSGEDVCLDRIAAGHPAIARP
jgi:hypothetical protein